MRKVWQLTFVIGIWLVCVVCIRIMKKIEPYNKIYLVWALFITIVFTLFAISDWLG